MDVEYILLILNGSVNATATTIQNMSSVLPGAAGDKMMPTFFSDLTLWPASDYCCLETRKKERKTGR